MTRRPFVLALVLIPAALPGTAQSTSQSQPAQAELQQRITLATKTLQHWYLPQTGLYRSTGWWNSANALTALVDSIRATGSREYLPLLDETYSHAQIRVPKARQVGDLHDMTGAPNFLNNYYDDEGWWALAWIDAYDLTQQPRYLAMGQAIFADMAGGWDRSCGGGIWWSKDRTYKNAIANELFFSVAAHLAARPATPTGQTAYREWAAREWRWFVGSGMINPQHLVNDGLTIDAATGKCTNNGRTTWTYNQGVLLGALAVWHQSEPDPALLPQARTIADAALSSLTGTDGVLHEPCEPNCGPDGVQFKGIFVRNLRLLAAEQFEARYQQFFEVNANAIWTHDQGPDHTLGLVWSGPYTAANAATQSSALDALNAAIEPPR